MVGRRQAKAIVGMNLTLVGSTVTGNTPFDVAPE